MKTYNINNNGYDSKITCNFPDGTTKCKPLEMDDLKRYIYKTVTLQELGNKYFN